MEEKYRNLWKMPTVQLHLENTQNRSYDGHSLLLAAMKPDSGGKWDLSGIFQFYFPELLIKHKTLISIFLIAQLSSVCEPHEKTSCRG